ncbi:hypothetical protein [Candidatus Phytoplasma sacchari]
MELKIKKKYYFKQNIFKYLIYVCVLIFLLFKKNLVMGMDKPEASSSAITNNQFFLELNSESALKAEKQTLTNNHDSHYNPIFYDTLKNIRIDLLKQERLDLKQNSIRVLKELYSEIKIDMFAVIDLRSFFIQEEGNNYFEMSFLNQNNTFPISKTIKLYDLLDQTNKIENNEKIGVFRLVFDDYGPKIEIIDDSNLYREREAISENIFEIFIDKIEIFKKHNKLILNLLFKRYFSTQEGFYFIIYFYIENISFIKN